MLLIHQIPPNPAYFRAKVLRRLNQLGALAVKNSAYLLPSTEDTYEDFEWLRREIKKGGGEAWLFRSEVLGGLSDESLCEAFRKLRAPEFAELAQAARDFLNGLRASEDISSGINRRKLKRWYDELCRIDYFGAPGRREVEVLIKEIDRIGNSPGQPSRGDVPSHWKGRTWVTRRGVKVDRIASAWLIRRFIDPAAKFVFADPQTYRHSHPEIRFDMFEGEFTHDGESCTFEVLLRFTGITDPALAAVAEVVHDIDLRDGKYQRPETAGVGLLIDGIALRHSGDMRRLEDGAILFEALYAQMRSQPRV